MAKKESFNLNKIAAGRCEKLIRMAAQIHPANPARARHYVELANRIAMRHRIHLDARKYCRKCFTPLVAGSTLVVRLDSRNRRVLYVCAACGAKRAFGYMKVTGNAKENSPRDDSRKKAGKIRPQAA